MNADFRTSKHLWGVTAAALAVLVVAGCGSSGSPAPVVSSSAAPVAAAPPGGSGSATATPAQPPAATSGAPSAGAGAGGRNTLTLSGPDGGSYEFGAVACVGDPSPNGVLSLSATPKSVNVAVAQLVFKDGQAQLVLTAKGSRPFVWKGKAPVGQEASRTADGAKLTGLPVREEQGATGTVSGTLTCSGTIGLN
ncbi:hypothetical protein ATKI12_6636 [Kitasatospora sp. Ki12]|uniref:hypothetical protein n=1 Tax=Kitasatospora xanthocidica TaxID=83382 RepID=UPI001676CF17|nr:hypothetical protein [Kitasatospora xanthocidica]